MAPRMLPNWIGRVTPVVTLLLVALLSLPSDAATKKAAPKGTGNPFDLLKGYWTGGGTIAPGKKSSPERVSCHVTYNVAGANVSQSMRCAGTDYKFNKREAHLLAAARSLGPGARAPTTPLALSAAAPRAIPCMPSSTATSSRAG
jgi:hypothetical protein